MSLSRKLRSLLACLIVAGLFLPAVAPLRAAPQSATQSATQSELPSVQTEESGGETLSVDGQPGESSAAVTDPLTPAENPGDPESEPNPSRPAVLIHDDAVIFGILMVLLALVFWTSARPSGLFRRFYSVVPMLLMCYFLPSLLTLFHVVDPEESSLYFVATRYMLPASLVLLTLSIDLREILRLGPKALVMFLTGTVGVIVGGPLAILIIASIHPDWVGGVGPDAVWRGLTTVAGSWIGGGANQVAMKEAFGVGDQVFSAMVAVDILVAEFWMMFLLLGVGKADRIDRWLKADASSIERLKRKMEDYSLSKARIASTTDLVVMAAIGFGGTAISHFAGAWLGPLMKEIGESGSAYQWVLNFNLDSSFFWIVVTATTVGVLLSMTPLRSYEGAGASKLGTLFIFILVAVIGMRMDLSAIVKYWELFLVGLVWMLIHVGLLFAVAKLIRAPFFFLAVGSKANIGGAASAPVVAAAFHPALAPVGVLLAVLGYALGTYGALVCGWLMEGVAPQ